MSLCQPCEKLGRHPWPGNKCKDLKGSEGHDPQNREKPEENGMRWSWRDPTGPLVLGSTEVGGFYFNGNEKLLKGLNQGSDIVFKDHQLLLCEAKAAAGQSRGCCHSSRLMISQASTGAVEMEQSRWWVSDLFWRWNQKYWLNGWLWREGGIKDACRFLA